MKQQVVIRARPHRASPRYPLLATLVGLGLRFLIFLVVAGALTGSGMVAWAHLQREWADKPSPEQALALAQSGAGRPLTLTTLEDYALEIYLRTQEQAILHPAGVTTARVRFRVASGETAVDISNRLQQQGLITDANLFRLHIRHEGVGASLEAGDFVLSSDMNIPAIAAALQKARIQDVAVTIPEGLRAEEIADILQKSDVTSGDAFLALVRSGNLTNAGLPDYPFLADRPATASLEGYLFPDTYRFPMRGDAADVLRIFLDNFDRRVTPELRQEATARNLSLYDVLTVAAIVEREAVLADERPIIAGVYLNRIQQNMLLNADPTVQYAMGFQPETATWWKTPVSLEEYSGVISPYNTYLNTGLPPGPICNPGLSAITAVIRPTPSDYIYFVATGEGNHVFARTAEEHQANVARFQGQ